MSLPNIRRSTTLKTRGLELPEAFQLATINAAANAYERNTNAKTRRRLAEKALRIARMP